MNWEPVNVWTNTLYTLIHSLHLSKAIHFGNLSYLEESARDAGSWVGNSCSYNSILLSSPDGKKRLTFRRDPNKHFEEISAQIVKMLVQDLVVILDSMLSEALLLHGETAGQFPQSKIQKLTQRLGPKHIWSSHGCLELVAVRNVLEHNMGRWNDRSIAIVAPHLSTPPVEGDKLSIGFTMLFFYRKAMRTFINQVSRTQASIPSPPASASPRPKRGRTGRS